MEYELARQLKSVGFPQEITENFNGRYVVDDDLGGVVYFPSLSELIENCKENFIQLGRYTHMRPELNLRFFAQGKLTKSKLQKHLGATPEEAVARLWLELNKR